MGAPCPTGNVASDGLAHPTGLPPEKEGLEGGQHSIRWDRALARFGIAALVAGGLLFGMPLTGHAQCVGLVCTVTIDADPGTNSAGTTGAAGTLSHALAFANAQTQPVTINIQTDVNLSGPLSPIFNSVTINGNGNTIDAGGTTRIFMVGVDEATRTSGAVAGSIIADRPQVEINDMTLANGTAQGGNGFEGGAGGMGAGGALSYSGQFGSDAEDNAAKGHVTLLF